MKYFLRFSFLILVLTFSVNVEATVPAPTGNSTQFFCDSESLTLADAAIFNTPGYTDIYWYADANQTGSAIDVNTIVMTGDVYYAFQAIGTDSVALEVNFILINVIPAPYMDGDIPIAVCESESITLGELPLFNTAGFYGIYWFSTADQQASTELAPNTIVQEGVNYFAFQGIGDCTISLSVTVEEFATIEAPLGSSEQYFCDNVDWTLDDILVANTGTFNGIYWFSTADQSSGSELNPITTILVDGMTFYAFQGVGDCAEPLAVTVEMMVEDIPAPDGDTEQYFCSADNSTLSDLLVYTNLVPTPNLIWFAEDDNTGTPIASDTLLVYGETYYAFQGLGTCAESLAVMVVENCNYITVTKTADVTEVSVAGDEITYTVKIDNIDLVAVYITGVLDLLVDLTLISGDTNSDALLDPTETWVYTGVYAVTQEVIDGDGIDVDLELNNDGMIDNCIAVMGASIISGTPIDINTGTVDPEDPDFDLCETVSIDNTASVDSSDSSLFIIYPNPVHQKLTVKLKDDFSKTNLTITTIQGQIVFQSEIQHKDIINIDISSFITGVYSLNITSNKLSQTKKLIVE